MSKNPTITINLPAKDFGLVYKALRAQMMRDIISFNNNPDNDSLDNHITRTQEILNSIAEQFSENIENLEA